MDILREADLTFAHIGATGPVTLTGGPVVLRQKFGGIWPTDHYPVFADYTLD